MEISPAKTLEVISDSEGEEDHVRAGDSLHRLQHDPNVGILPVSRDWHIHSTTATMSSSNPSSHISQFPTMPPAQPPTPALDSSIQPGSEWPATNPRPRPRPRMRPVPPPDNTDTSIGAFSAIPPTLAQPPTDTVSSFGNSAVQDVPNVRPPSLPPSSLPATDSSSSIPQPTFPITPAPQQNIKSKSKPGGPANATMSATPSNTIAPPAISTEPLAFPSSKRPKPKMRPPPPPEPSTSTSTTAPSVAATDSGSNPNANPSTSATSNSGNSKTGSAQQRSALDEAEEYTGRGARRLAQPPKPKPDDYIDVGGPEDVIMLIDSSDTEQTSTKPKPKSKPKKKPTPKQAKRPVPIETEVPGALDHESSSRVPSTTGRAKRRPLQPQTSEDELGRWDVPIPGEPSSAPVRTTSAKKRREAVIQDSDDEAANLPAPPYAPDTIALPGNTSDPARPPMPSSPLSSLGHSPVAKRKLELSSMVDEGLAPTTAKRSRKNPGTMEVVLRAPVGQGDSSKKSKAKPKGKGKPAPTTLESSNSTEGQAHAPSALEATTAASPCGLIPESSKAGTTPQPMDDGAGPNVVATIMDVDLASTEVEPAPTTTKKPRKKVARGKKGAASEVIAAEGSVGTPATGAKKTAKNKGKSKAKEVNMAASLNDAGTPPVVPDAIPPNLDTGVAASSSNPGAGDNCEAGPSNTPVPNQTPAPKSSRPKPRHSTTPAPLPVAMGASGALLRTTGRKSSDRPLSETLRLTLGGTGTPPPRVGLSRRGSSKIAPLLAFRGAPPPPPPPMPKKPTRKKKGQSDDENSEEGSEWEKLTEKQKEKKRREKEVAGWYSD